jgi:YVTN family beta-propeller protein
MNRDAARPDPRGHGRTSRRCPSRRLMVAVALGINGGTLGCHTAPTGPSGVSAHHPSLQHVDSVPLGGGPFAVAISPAGIMYVTELDGGMAARALVGNDQFGDVDPVGPLPSQIRMSPDGATAFVSNQNAQTVTYLDVARNMAVGSASIPSPSSILTIGVGLSGRRIYALTDYYGVYVIDAGSRRVIDSIAPTHTGSILTGIAFHPTLPRAYIASQAAHTITVIDVSADTVITTYLVNGGGLQTLAVATDGSELYATDNAHGAILVWDLQNGSSTYQTIFLPLPATPFDVEVSPDNAQLYVSLTANGKLYVIDRATRQVTDSIVTGGAPRYIAFGGGGTEAVIPNEAGFVDFVH